MRLPKLNRINTSRSMVDVFKGYNHNLRIGEGEFYDMTNLTSDDYPVLSPRRKRGVYTIDPESNKPIPKAYGLISKDSLCYVANNRLYINGYAVQDTESADMSLTDGDKTLISMGAYIIIMPDKKYVNTENQGDCGSIEAEAYVKSGTVQFALCKLDGEEFNVPEGNISDKAPPLPKKETEGEEGGETEGEEEYEEEWEDGTMWLDTSGDTHVLKRYSTVQSQWVSIPTTYIKILFSDKTIKLNQLFSDEEGLLLSGIKDIATDDVKEQLSTLDTTVVAWKVGEDYIIVKGILDKVTTLSLSEKAPISIKRQMPIMDFIIESGNRLWGCHYGEALNGQIVNEIYASKLGDFKNWNTFASISTDSYVATVGSDGKFTGAITHLGYPIFFKENCFHKVYGNYPANYQIQTTACRGVQEDCEKSLAIVNETLFYKSRSAVCAYDGSLPVEISSALGDKAYSDAVAGVLGNKYYISMKDESGNYHLFVYDTKKGMWHREDDTQAIEFCNCRGELYFIDDGEYDDENRVIKTVRGTGNAHESSVEWSAETGIIGTESPDKKYISRIDVRLLLNIGTKVTIYAEYDSSGAWEHILTMDGTSLRTFSVPVRPKRCDHLRLKIAGTGDVKIFSICKTIAQGSDI